MKRLFFYILVAMMFTTGLVFAKTINLYLEPKTDSKVTSSVNIEDGVTIVYTPKSGEWIKVANPANGDVGWVKSSDLGANGYSMRVVTSSDGAHRYSVYQYGAGNSQYNQQQIEKQMQQFEQQQRKMQMHMAQMFNDVFNFPQTVFIPVVMIPEQTNTQKKPAANEIQKNVQPAQGNKN